MNSSYVIQLESDKSFHEALQFMKKAHEGQKRDFSGQPYYIHPLRVASFLYARGVNTDAVIAALLHDVLEDTKVTEQDIIDNFGNQVCQHVVALSDPSKLDGSYKKKTKEERLQGVIERLKDAPHLVKNIKLVDMLDNTIDMCRYYHLNIPRAKRFLENKRALYQSLPDKKMYGYKETRLWLKELEMLIKDWEIKNK